MEKRRQPEIIAGRINADGTIAAGDGFAVQKTGTGTYDIRIRGGFRVANAVANYVGGFATVLVHTSAYVENGFTVATMTTAAAGQDQPFSFVAVGVQQ
jgi:hypothetical protein